MTVISEIESYYMKDVHIKQGVVRGNHFVISFECNEVPCNDFDIIFLHRDAFRHFSVNLTRPDEARARGLGICKVSAENSNEWTVKIPKSAVGEPVYRVDVKYAGEDISIIVDDKNFHLIDLFVDNDDQYRKIYVSSRGRRSSDPETVLFAMEQLVGHGLLSLGYMASALTILCYRAMDALDEDRMRFLMDKSKSYIDLLSECPSSNDIRQDGEHLMVSLSLARWHMALLIGDRAYFEKTLNESVDLIRHIENYWSTGFNATKTVFIAAYLAWRSGRIHMAEKLFRFVIAIYKRAVAVVSDRNEILLADLQHCNRLAVLSVIAIKNMHNKPTNGHVKVGMEHIKVECLRVLKAPPLTAMVARLELHTSTNELKSA